MRQLNVGCFGGGTGLPSLLGGLKTNPWLRLNAVVTMFDSGGSSGQLRDQLGVLPPGDVLKCALALARNEAEARRVLLSRVPSIDPASPVHAIACGPGIGNSASCRPHRRQSAAVDDGAVQRRFPGGGRRAALAARLHGPRLAGQRRAGQRVRRIQQRRADARRSGSRSRAEQRPVRQAHLARAVGARFIRPSTRPSARSTPC